MLKFLIRLFAVAIITSVSVSLPYKASAKSNFVMIKLQYGVSIDIPRNWKTLTNDQLITLDTTVESQLDLSNLPKGTSDLGFVAVYSDDVGDKAKINVRYYPEMKVTQDAVRKTNPEELRKFDNTLKQSIYGAARASGDTILSWGGTRKQDFSGRIALVTKYHRPPFSGEQGSFNVQLIRMLDGPKSFTLTVSYDDLYATIFKPICDRIVSSLKIRN